jgi:hypothetical protein
MISMLPLAETLAEFAVRAPVSYMVMASAAAAFIGLAGQMATGGKG